MHSRVEVATWRLKRGAGRNSKPYVLWRAQGVPSSMLEMALVLVLGGVSRRSYAWILESL